MRTPQEYREGHIPGSKNVPLQQLDKISSVADNKNIPLFVYCYSGGRSRQAASMLQHMGYTIDGFKNIPVDELRERIDEIEAGKPVYVICQSGLRSYIATRILEGYGFEAYNFAGGFRFYDAVMNDRALIETAYACGMDQ